MTDSSNISPFFNDTDRVVTRQPFMVINKRLKNFNRRRLSIPFMSEDMRLIGVNIEQKIISIAKNQINSDIHKTITKSLFDTTKFDYLDLRPDGSIQNGRVFLEKLFDLILINDYKNLITTGSICSKLCNSQFFRAYANTDEAKIPNGLDRVGNLSGKVDIYIDPYMKFNDGRICLFNEVEVNIEGMMSQQVVNPVTLQTNTLIKYDLSHHVWDSKLIFVIEDENSESFSQYKSLQRDIKIDKVLNGDQ